MYERLFTVIYIAIDTRGARSFIFIERNWPSRAHAHISARVLLSVIEPCFHKTIIRFKTLIEYNFVDKLNVNSLFFIKKLKHSN